MGECMRGFECAQYAFALRQRLEGGERLGVGCTNIFGPAAVLEMRMFWANRGIIEARGNRPGVGNLPVLVLQQIGFSAVEDARRSAQQGRAMLGPVEPAPRSLDPDQPHLIVEEVGEQADGV